jgi:hypothetical protein
MIADEEIEQKAAEFSISPINVEKDYVCKSASTVDQGPASNIDHRSVQETPDPQREMPVRPWSAFGAAWAKIVVKLRRLFTTWSHRVVPGM